MFSIFDKPIDLYLYPSADLVYTRELEKEYNIDLKGTKLYKFIVVNKKDIVQAVDLYIRTRFININGEMKREGIQYLLKESLFKDVDENGNVKVSLDRLLDDTKWVLCKTTWDGNKYFVYMNLRSDYVEYGPLEIYLEFHGNSENSLVKNIKRKVLKRM